MIHTITRWGLWLSSTGVLLHNSDWKNKEDIGRTLPREYPVQLTITWETKEDSNEV